jgi:hypothetical protein
MDEQEHWRIFNFLMRRVVAIAFMAGGTLLFLQGARHLLPGGTIVIDGHPTDDVGMRLIVTVLPGVMAVLGALMFRARPYYPPGVKSDDTSEND